MEKGKDFFHLSAARKNRKSSGNFRLFVTWRNGEKVEKFYLSAVWKNGEKVEKFLLYSSASDRCTIIINPLATIIRIFSLSLSSPPKDHRTSELKCIHSGTEVV